MERRGSMRKQTFIGIIIVIIGLNILFNAIHFSAGSLLAPLIFFALGVFFYQRKHSFLSVCFFLIGASIFFDQLFGMNFFGLLVAIVALYYGFKLVRRSKEDKPTHRESRSTKKERKRTLNQEGAREFPEKIEINEQKKEREEPPNEQGREKESRKRDYFESTFHRSWIGDIHYTGEAFELKDITIWNGLGDVRFDLSKAIIPEGETVIVVQGIIGQIDFFVPDDLALSIQASSLLGDISLFHEKHSGINKQLSVASKGYKLASRRVKLVLSTMVGEVKVKAI